jgi:hypothetical protein
MDQLTRQHTPRAIAAGMWIGLWTGELIAAAEYWLARGATFGLAAAQMLFKQPVIIAGVFGLASLGALAYEVVQAKKDCSIHLARVNEAQIFEGAKSFRLREGNWPTQLETLVPGHLQELHADPWGRPYAYYRGEGGIAIVSAGPDGVLGTSDDVVTIGNR